MNALETLAEEIKPIHAKLMENAKFVDCSRCCGKGVIPAFYHVKGGICFKCGDSKKAASNKAAKNARKMVWLFNSIKRSWKLGIREIDGLTPSKELKSLIETLPKKYKA